MITLPDTCIEWVIPAVEHKKDCTRKIYIVKEWDGNIFKSYDEKYKPLIKSELWNNQQ